MRDAETAGDVPKLTEAHLQFHEAIYRLSGHELLAEIFALIHPRMALALTFAENLFESKVTRRIATFPSWRRSLHATLSVPNALRRSWRPGGSIRLRSIGSLLTAHLRQSRTSKQKP